MKPSLARGVVDIRVSFKVGHTYRPPYRRANELSRTALPAAFHTAYARFFWAAVEAERAAHAHLRQLLPGDACSKEFFRLDAPSLRRVIEEMPSPPARRAPAVLSPFEPDAPWWNRAPDPDWDRSSDGLEEQWTWAVERIGLRGPAAQRQGWRELERLSSSGWGEASWRRRHLDGVDPGGPGCAGGPEQSGSRLNKGSHGGLRSRWRTRLLRMSFPGDFASLSGCSNPLHPPPTPHAPSGFLP